MLRTARLIAAWFSAVAVLGRLGPTPSNFRLASGVARTPAAWPSWMATHPDEALAVLAAGVAWLLLAWLAVAFLVVVGGAGAGRGHRWCRSAARVLVPRVVRRSLEAALGLGVAALTATPALAVPAGPTPPVPSLDRAPATSVRLAPLPAVPAPVLAPSSTPQPAAAAPTPGRRPAATSRPSLPDVDRAPPKVDDAALTGALPSDDEIVVRRGDCLWTVVERSLGPTASDADVARTWPRWYAHNRSAIGADPDLLLPGTVLTPPPQSAVVP